MGREPIKVEGLPEEGVEALDKDEAVCITVMGEFVHIRVGRGGGAEVMASNPRGVILL